jgi:hypothetical protein
MTPSTPAPTGSRASWSAGITAPLLIVMVLTLGAANVATVASSTFHDLVFGMVQRALLIFGTEAAENLLQSSLKRESEAHTRKATALLTEENNALNLKNKQLGLQKGELDVKHTKALADADAAKVAHARTSSELGDVKLKRVAEAKHAKAMATSVRTRLAKGVVRNNAAIPGEAIPYIGIGVTLGVMALDLYDACQTMQEINELMTLLGQGEENADFCGMKIPTVPQVLARMRTEWKAGAEQVAREAKGLSAGVPVPEVRLPSAAEARAVICPLIGSKSWMPC